MIHQSYHHTPRTYIDSIYIYIYIYIVSSRSKGKVSTIIYWITISIGAIGLIFTNTTIEESKLQMLFFISYPLDIHLEPGTT